MNFSFHLSKFTARSLIKTRIVATSAKQYREIVAGEVVAVRRLQSAASAADVGPIDRQVRNPWGLGGGPGVVFGVLVRTCLSNRFVIVP